MRSLRVRELREKRGRQERGGEGWGEEGRSPGKRLEKNSEPEKGQPEDKVRSQQGWVHYSPGERCLQKE